MKILNFKKPLLMTMLLSSMGFYSAIIHAEEELIGSGEFFNSCASCHGVSAKGDGNLSRYLNIKPTDLTQLAKNNQGEYPFLKVFQIIDGRSEVPGHGDRIMPVWGDRYEIETKNSSGLANESATRAKVLELVYYIQSIQQK